MAISTMSARSSPAPISNIMSKAQLAPVVKSEPRVVSLCPSPAGISSSVLAADRLGPIRAAKEAIRSIPGSQVQSPVTPYAEHQGGGIAPNFDVNGSSVMRDLWRLGPSPPAAAAPPQQNPTPQPNGIGQQSQINLADVEAVLRAHGLMMPQTQQMPIASSATLPGQNMAALQSGLNILNRVSTSGPGSSVLAPSQPMQPTNGAGPTVQSVQTSQYPPAMSQAPLYLPAPQSRLSNGTHLPRHSLPHRPPPAAPSPINTLPRADPIANQPPPYSGSSTGSFKDDRRYSDYERRGYSTYEKDYRRHGSSGRRSSSGYDSRKGRVGGWDQRGS